MTLLRLTPHSKIHQSTRNADVDLTWQPVVRQRYGAQNSGIQFLPRDSSYCTSRYIHRSTSPFAPCCQPTTQKIKDSAVEPRVLDSTATLGPGEKILLGMYGFKGIKNTPTNTTNFISRNNSPRMLVLVFSNHTHLYFSIRPGSGERSKVHEDLFPSPRV